VEGFGLWPLRGVLVNSYLESDYIIAAISEQATTARDFITHESCCGRIVWERGLDMQNMFMFQHYK
jgi:hypothetical protein